MAILNNNGISKKTTNDSRQDARPVQHLSRQVRQVAEDEDEQGLDDLDVTRVLGDEAADQPEQDADERATHRDDHERPDPASDVNGENVGLSHLREALQHVVHHLK